MINNNRIIISLAGRKGCGKTTLVQILLDRGFIKISFADYLKEKVAILLNLSLSDMYDINKKDQLFSQPIVYNLDLANKLKGLCNLNKIVYYEDYNLKSIRDTLQYIGTEILRSYDKDFHTKKFVEKVNATDKNVVCDDHRFPEETIVLDQLNATKFFIIRPSNFDYSNHSSETSLNRNNFENILINNTSLSVFKNSLSKLIDYKLNIKSKNVINRDTLFKLLLDNHYDINKVAQILDCSIDKIMWWAKRFCIYIQPYSYIYNHDVFYTATKESAYFAGLISADGCIKKSGYSQTCPVLELSNNDQSLLTGFKKFLQTNKPIYKKTVKNGRDNYYLTVNSVFIVEDMKLWCIEPRKSKYNKPPDIIKNNRELLDYWLVGLIDGDGSIFYTKYKGKISNIGISCLASKEVVEFIQKKYPEIKWHIDYNVKNIKNLCNIRCGGKEAVKFYQLVYHGVGLKRKWSKLNRFVNKIWKS